MNKKLNILVPVIIIVMIIILIFQINGKKNKQTVNENTKAITVIKDSSVQIKKDTSKKGKLTFNTNNQNTEQLDTVTKTKNTEESEKNDNSGWKAYINKEIGLKFNYPNDWKKDTNEIRLTDLKGNIKSVEIHFSDTVTGSDLLVRYHPNPGGTKLYNYLFTQYEKAEGEYQYEKKEVEIDGYKAIFGSSVRKIDGKGHKIDPPSKLITIDLLCDKLSGKLELQYRTQEGNKVAEDTFSQLINTIELL